MLPLDLLVCWARGSFCGCGQAIGTVCVAVGVLGLARLQLGGDLALVRLWEAAAAQGEDGALAWAWGLPAVRGGGGWTCAIGAAGLGNRSGASGCARDNKECNAPISTNTGTSLQRIYVGQEEAPTYIR